MTEEKVLRWSPPKISLAGLTLKNLESKARNLGFTLLGDEIIQDFKEASEAAMSLRFIDADDYHLRWNFKLRLPYFPDIFYCKNGWRNDLEDAEAWRVYLGTSINRNNAPTRAQMQQSLFRKVVDERKAQAISEPYSYDEAVQVNIARRFKSIVLYLRFAAQDFRLPANPKLVYGKEFRNWAEYFGHYSLERAFEIIRERHFATRGEYWKLSRKDWRLPLDTSLYGVPGVDSLQDIELFILAAWKNKI